MFCGGILLFCYCMYISDYSPPFKALGACDAFLRSVGAQALRGGLAKNATIGRAIICHLGRSPQKNSQFLSGTRTMTDGVLDVET